MAAATKARTSLWSAQSLTAGAGDTTSSVINLSTTYGSAISVTLTNGATGPTIPARVQVQVANDYNAGSPTLWCDYGGAFTGGVANSGVYSCPIDIPIGVAAVRLVAGSNTGQAVVVNADISSVTAVS